jgi:hypothetical protein
MKRSSRKLILRKSLAKVAQDLGRIHISKSILKLMRMEMAHLAGLNFKHTKEANRRIL